MLPVPTDDLILLCVHANTFPESPVRRGYDVLRETSMKSGIPIVHTTGRKEFLEAFLADGRDAQYIGEPVALQTYMHRSWEAFTHQGL